MSKAWEAFYQNTMDPIANKNCICLEKLPICTASELESICLPYGNVVQIKALRLPAGFAVVEFETEQIALRAASALHGSTFKGNLIAAYMAPQSAPTQPQPPNPDSDYNDCEIIVLDQKNIRYAEFVERRLKRLGMRVDLLFPNKDVPLGKVLSNISARRCLYAVLVTNQHEEHNSVTVNVLYGAPAEHRNMPVEDAISFIGTDFHKKMGSSMPASVPMIGMHSNIGSIPVQPIQPAVPLIKDRHPEHIQKLINLLADNVRLTVLQFNCIIKYLEDLRAEQTKIELGTDAAEVSKPNSAPDPELEVQKRILDILNKPSIADNNYPLMYPSLDSVKKDPGLMNLLRDERVQRAIDSIMDSNLVSVVGENMKF